MKRLLVVLALVLCARTAVGQVVRGTVRDSASQRLIPGAVLLLLDASGRVLGRNLTNERGEYAVARTATMQRVRVQRIASARASSHSPRGPRKTRRSTSA
jgi:hypothetical protein